MDLKTEVESVVKDYVKNHTAFTINDIGKKLGKTTSVDLAKIGAIIFNPTINFLAPYRLEGCKPYVTTLRRRGEGNLAAIQIVFHEQGTDGTLYQFGDSQPDIKWEKEENKMPVLQGEGCGPKYITRKGPDLTKEMTKSTPSFTVEKEYELQKENKVTTTKAIGTVSMPQNFICEYFSSYSDNTYFYKFTFFINLDNVSYEEAVEDIKNAVNSFCDLDPEDLDEIVVNHVNIEPEKWAEDLQWLYQTAEGEEIPYAAKLTLLQEVRTDAQGRIRLPYAIVDKIRTGSTIQIKYIDDTKAGAKYLVYETK